MGVSAIDLSGQWFVRKKGEKQSISATVPGCVHTDLLAAGVIEEPFFRDNELRLQWIGQTDWIYSRAFDLPADFLGRSRVLLRCEGLDTLATIRLNGRIVGQTENMFRLYEFDVTNLIKMRQNVIEIRFDSAVAYCDKRQAERPLPYWGQNEKAAAAAWMRKSQCNFGWDWGPNFVTCGIWRPISIVGFDDARIETVFISQDHSKPNAVNLALEIEAEKVSRSPLSAAVSVSFGGQAIARQSAAFRGARADLALAIDKPRLWWPNGMGDQPLYDIKVELLDGEGRTLDVWARRIGLRRLELERVKDEWGESFRFAANGIAFFAKGANWIPGDAFVTRMAAEDYRRLLGDAKAVHMNMLRVWGGGIYEPDAFYDLCDELGICVWQDFMFACSTYPVFDKAFMANVAKEVEDTVRRLRHHACLALWCGNNELEQGLVKKEWSKRSMSWKDYKKLFDDLIPKIVKKLDPVRPYWPSSAHSPLGDREDHSNPNWGDAHLWTVWHGNQPFEWYRTSFHRFCSEFGFQSFPEPKTVASFTEPRDRNVTSFVMEHHQRSGIGNSKIMNYMLSWFRLPRDFESTLWLSQIQQGMAMKYAIEHWRRHMPRCMGALYWQINDCWPVASWASIDYPGRWKALHYMARRFFAPQLVSGVEHAATGAVDIHVTNDGLKRFEGEIAWRITNVAGETLEQGAKAIRAAARASMMAKTVSCAKYLKSLGPRDLMIWLWLYDKDGNTVSSNFVSFARPKHMELEDPVLKTGMRATGSLRYSLSVEARRPALYVWIDMGDVDARLSDNFFHLAPGEQKRIEIECASAQVPRPHAKSLVDTY